MDDASDSSRPVDRCVCRDVRFAMLVRLHQEQGADFTELQEMTNCGTGCGLCIPYIKVALRTGEARLPVMSDAELRRLGGMDRM
jgi:bacterioferritin-associated ferredoxin